MVELCRYHVGKGFNFELDAAAALALPQEILVLFQSSKLLSATTPNTTHHEAQIQCYLLWCDGNVIVNIIVNMHGYFKTDTYFREFYLE